MPMFNFRPFFPLFSSIQAVSVPAPYLLMAMLAFLLGICITLLFHHLRRLKALTPPEDDSHEL